MYAVVTTGGKQYKVEKGETLKIEKIPGEIGSRIDFDQILMVSDGDRVEIGQPLVEKHKKILVFKYKRRKRYRRKQGHRQQFTAVRIDDISI